MRLIAALVVVLHHTSFYSMDDIADDLLSSATGGTLSFGRPAVDVFFIISGVLVAPGHLRPGDIITFVCNRALRIIPALVAVRSSGTSPTASTSFTR
ncbi:MAG: acyltransferase [Pararhizobium sp.]